MATQDTYLTSLPKAFEGMIADTEPCVLISRQVEGAAIGFGRAVKQGTADRGVAAASAAADKYRGITVRDQSVLDGSDFNVGEDALIMTKGVIWVTAYDTVVAGAPVYVAVTNTSYKFTDTATTNLAIPNAVFEDSGSADELVRIRLG